LQLEVKALLAKSTNLLAGLLDFSGGLANLLGGIASCINGTSTGFDNFADAVAERVHRPAGLDLGGRSPAEIALAILAALVADRHQAPVGQP